MTIAPDLTTVRVFVMIQKISYLLCDNYIGGK